MLIVNILHRSVGYARTGTLSQAPMSASASRDLLEDVGHAAWAPDGKTIAVVRAPEWHYRLEFPAGKVLYETAGWISYPRVLPRRRHGRVPRPSALRGRPRQCRGHRSPRERKRLSRPGGRALRESPGLLPERRSGSPRHEAGNSRALLRRHVCRDASVRSRSPLRHAALQDISRDGRLLFVESNATPRIRSVSFPDRRRSGTSRAWSGRTSQSSPPTGRRWPSASREKPEDPATRSTCARRTAPLP